MLSDEWKLLDTSFTGASLESLQLPKQKAYPVLVERKNAGEVLRTFCCSTSPDVQMAFGPALPTSANGMTSRFVFCHNPPIVVDPHRVQVGDIIDACDTVNKWYESKIVKMRDNDIFVNYIGWAVCPSPHATEFVVRHVTGSRNPGMSGFPRIQNGLQNVALTRSHTRRFSLLIISQTVF